MKLRDYLKQFEGLDLNLEVYKYNPPAEGWESETEYPEATRIDGEKPFELVYANSLAKDVFYIRSDEELNPRFDELIILV